METTLTSGGKLGSLVVAEFDSLEAAKRWAHDDPYSDAGVYANIQVRPLNGFFHRNTMNPINDRKK